MRMSTDEIKYEHVWNGFDYNLQVWVVGGVIQDCNHPKEMRKTGCCNGFKYAGKKIKDAGILFDDSSHEYEKDSPSRYVSYPDFILTISLHLNNIGISK